MRAIALCVLALASLSFAEDLRANYDVKTYRLDLQVDPAAKTLRGTVGVEARVLKPFQVFELDLMKGRKVVSVNQIGRITPSSSLGGKRLPFVHEDDRIRVTLPKRLEPYDTVRVAVTYELKDGQQDGITFNQTPDGKPWITTSCQVLGAHSWWPQKGENEHPEDKFEHLYMNVTVPKGLTAVCAGRLAGKTATETTETFHWRHDYPCQNYSVSLNVAPYVDIAGELKLGTRPDPIPYSYFVIPQDVEKARVQFEEVPRLLEIYEEAFGPYPFPNSKFGLVQTDYWGMEHSTAVAYGNSFPAWIKVHGGTDRWADFNKYFDYILIHEVAHEWWANAVSAKDWGHLWLHEGFGTYAEGVYVEKLMGREKADEYFATLRKEVSEQFRLFRGTGVLPRQAFDNNVYYKGALVLNTLRHYLDDDAAWWRSLREFNLRFRYKNATTEDFRRVLEEVTGKDWTPFFEQWFYGDGFPALRGTATAETDKIVVEVENPPIRGVGFQVPLDLAWKAGVREYTKRVLLQPGSNRIEIPSAMPVENLRVVNLHRILGDNQVTVKG